ncbi:unnamed protein product [Toxocara canis]|uniref:SEA domain-containing protein n=1 Tax=Toxocara canis TaxID=6265 RepID=A0A183V3R6_TOXCA|nr:unnamed protein product [Toxocara canis]
MVNKGNIRNAASTSDRRPYGLEKYMSRAPPGAAMNSDLYESISDATLSTTGYGNRAIRNLDALPPGTVKGATQDRRRDNQYSSSQLKQFEAAAEDQASFSSVDSKSLLYFERRRSRKKKCLWIGIAILIVVLILAAIGIALGLTLPKKESDKPTDTYERMLFAFNIAHYSSARSKRYSSTSYNVESKTVNTIEEVMRKYAGTGMKFAFQAIASRGKARLSEYLGFDTALEKLKQLSAISENANPDLEESSAIFEIDMRSSATEMNRNFQGILAGIIVAANETIDYFVDAGTHMHVLNGDKLTSTEIAEDIASQIPMPTARPTSSISTTVSSSTSTSATTETSTLTGDISRSSTTTTQTTTIPPPIETDEITSETAQTFVPSSSTTDHYTTPAITVSMNSTAVSVTHQGTTSTTLTMNDEDTTLFSSSSVRTTTESTTTSPSIAATTSSQLSSKTTSGAFGSLSSSTEIAPTTTQQLDTSSSDMTEDSSSSGMTTTSQGTTQNISTASQSTATTTTTTTTTPSTASTTTTPETTTTPSTTSTTTTPETTTTPSTTSTTTTPETTATSTTTEPYSPRPCDVSANNVLTSVIFDITELSLSSITGWQTEITMGIASSELKLSQSGPTSMSINGVASNATNFGHTDKTSVEVENDIEQLLANAGDYQHNLELNVAKALIAYSENFGDRATDSVAIIILYSTTQITNVDDAAHMANTLRQSGHRILFVISDERCQKDAAKVTGDPSNVQIVHDTIAPIITWFHDKACQL